VKKLRGCGHRSQVLSRRPGGGKDWVQGYLSTNADLAEAV
jgi:hypothetical protein